MSNFHYYYYIFNFYLEHLIDLPLFDIFVNLCQPRNVEFYLLHFSLPIVATPSIKPLILPLILFFFLFPLKTL